MKDNFRKFDIVFCIITRCHMTSVMSTSKKLNGGEHNVDHRNIGDCSDTDTEENSEFLTNSKKNDLEERFVALTFLFEKVNTNSFLKVFTNLCF